MSVHDGRARYAAAHRPKAATTLIAADIMGNAVTRGRALHAAEHGDKEARALLDEVDAAYAALAVPDDPGDDAA